jgi:hypothetical protein
MPFGLRPCLGNGCVMRVCKLIRSGRVRQTLQGHLIPVSHSHSFSLIFVYLLLCRHIDRSQTLQRERGAVSPRVAAISLFVVRRGVESDPSLFRFLAQTSCCHLIAYLHLIQYYLHSPHGPPRAPYVSLPPPIPTMPSPRESRNFDDEHDQADAAK